MATKKTPERTQVRAQAKWVRMSARKARLVLDLLRGRSVPEARTILAFTPRAAAREIDRVLASAVANAESAHGLDGDELIVLEAYADEGPTLKRWRARARGRAAQIQKHTCHITVKLAPLAVEAKPARPQAKPAEAETQEEKPTRKPRAARPKADTATAAKPTTSRRKKTEKTEETEEAAE